MEEGMSVPATKQKRTESEMLALLRAKHGEKDGNGVAYAFVTSVRSAAGFDAKRTLDAVAMSLWPSRGLVLDGFEVKCSRSDWLRELKAPEKAEEFARLLDRLWVVAGDKDIVKDGELPPDWGLLVARGNGLTTSVQAEFLHDSPSRRGAHPLPSGFGRSFLAALLREAVRVGKAVPEEVLAAEERGAEKERSQREWEKSSYKPLYDELNAQVREFEDALGMPITGRKWRRHDYDPKSVGQTMRMVLNGEVELTGLRKRLLDVAQNAEWVARAARERAGAIEVEDERA